MGPHLVLSFMAGSTSRSTYFEHPGAHSSSLSTGTWAFQSNQGLSPQAFLCLFSWARSLNYHGKFGSSNGLMGFSFASCRVWQEQDSLAVERYDCPSSQGTHTSCQGHIQTSPAPCFPPEVQSLKKSPKLTWSGHAPSSTQSLPQVGQLSQPSLYSEMDSRL